jgi:hypothetical protein
MEVRESPGTCSEILPAQRVNRLPDVVPDALLEHHLLFELFEV